MQIGNDLVRQLVKSSWILFSREKNYISTQENCLAVLLLFNLIPSFRSLARTCHPTVNEAELRSRYHLIRLKSAIGTVEESNLAK